MRRRWGGLLALVALAVITGLPSVISRPATKPSEIRLSGSEARLVTNGHVVRAVPLSSKRPVRLDALAGAVADDGWIGQPAPGVFELHAALIQEPGTDLLVAAPAVRELRLLTAPGVHLWGTAAKARFEGVKVTSWDAAKGAPPTDPTVARPFLLYENGSRLEVVRSELAYLGYESAGMSSPGVSWRRQGTTGEAVGSTFHHSFLGAYAAEAQGIAFRDNIFRDNQRQGLHVRGPASGIVVEGNAIFGNGADGVLLSAGVTDSTLAGNRVYGNAGNGITLRGVDRNRVTGNLVEGSGGDGIVLTGSSGNLVGVNIARAQRIGVRVDGASADNSIEGNRLQATGTGLRLSGGSTGARLSGNEVDGAPVGIVLDAPGTTMKSTTVRAVSLAVDVRAAVSVSDLVTVAAERGVLVRRGARADLEHLTVEASRVGLSVEQGSDTSLTQSRLVAQTPVQGAGLRSSTENTLVPLGGTAPVPWLAGAAILILLIAVGLEVLRSRRDPERAVHAPVGIWNIA
jgi:parallel beta-helix repeat protein